MQNPPLEDLIPLLRRRARRLTPSQSDAEDLLQDALLRVLQKLEKGQQIDALGPYAMRTLHNQARMRWRGPPPPEELEDDAVAVDPVAMSRLECADTLQAIDALPPDQADLMRLVCGGETSPAALADQMDVPVGTVMSRLSRARARLRDTLGEKPNDTSART